MKTCKWCGKEFEDYDYLSFGGHTINCEKQPNEIKESRYKKISQSSKGKHLSEDHKKKISESRKKFLLENPDKVPYKLNHKHKETYPEKYFKNVLKGFICQYRPEGTLYEIDFANPDKKIAIEIDGEQHYVDPLIVEHDKIRTSVLNNLGWQIIRIRWSYFILSPLIKI